MNVELIMMKGIISELPEENQAKVKACRDELLRIVEENGEEGFLALALLGIEKANEVS